MRYFSFVFSCLLYNLWKLTDNERNNSSHPKIPLNSTRAKITIAGSVMTTMNAAAIDRGVGLYV